jgi:hypothetical protein
MGFRYDMRNKSPQQQAIVRQRDRADELVKEEKSKEITCTPIQRTGDFEAVYFSKGSTKILELRISHTAMVNAPCNLKGVKIHDWLCKTGKSFINNVKDFEILMITSYDVQDQKLMTNWKNLRREQIESE